MPSVMLRRNEAGQISFYVAKKDLEETIVSVEIDTPEQWGGEIGLADGSKYYIAPTSGAPKFPFTVRAKRVGGEED